MENEFIRTLCFNPEACKCVRRKVTHIHRDNDVGPSADCRGEYVPVIRIGAAETSSSRGRGHPTTAAAEKGELFYSAICAAVGRSYSENVVWAIKPESFRSKSIGGNIIEVILPVANPAAVERGSFMYESPNTESQTEGD
jgi:hypothetical protein